MRLDAHQHFWRYNTTEYGWMKPGMEVLKRDYLPPDLQPLLQASGFAGSILVQARSTLEETRWYLELAEQNAFIKGVVGWVDLLSPELPRQLELFATNRKFVGVRHILETLSADFMLQAAFVRGIATLADFDLAYDILIYAHHLPAACELVRQFPRQRFVLDHIAKPRIKEHILEPWATDIRRLAAFPNVLCKLSGMVTEADWQNWTPADLLPYIDVAFEAFGPQRLMIGSDWPVCVVAAPYSRVMGLVVDYVRTCSPHEQELILGENARMFYRVST